MLISRWSLIAVGRVRDMFTLVHVVALWLVKANGEPMAHDGYAKGRSPPNRSGERGDPTTDVTNDPGMHVRLIAAYTGTRPRKQTGRGATRDNVRCLGVGA